MEIDLNITLTVSAKAKFTKQDKLKLVTELRSKIKSNLELLMSDIPIPNHEKLLDGYTYEVDVDEY